MVRRMSWVLWPLGAALLFAGYVGGLVSFVAYQDREFRTRDVMAIVSWSLLIAGALCWRAA